MEREPTPTSCASSRPPRPGLDQELRRHRPVVGLPGAAGEHQHPPDPGRDHQAAGPVPGQGFDPLEIDEYNRLTAQQVELVRDFIILHFKATERSDTPYWDYLRTMEIPESLARKIDLFAGRGRLFQSDYDLFAEPSWIAVLMGQGIVPRQYDALVDSLPQAALVQRLQRMSALIGQTAQAMPNHQAFIDRYCAADAAAGVPA
jgi:tryptophan halogenase